MIQATNPQQPISITMNEQSWSAFALGKCIIHRYICIYISQWHFIASYYSKTVKLSHTLVLVQPFTYTFTEREYRNVLRKQSLQLPSTISGAYTSFRFSPLWIFLKTNQCIVFVLLVFEYLLSLFLCTTNCLYI